MAIMRVRYQLSSLEGLPGLHTTYWSGASSTPTAADALDVAGRVRAFWNSLVGSLANALVVTPVAQVDVLDHVTGVLVASLPAGSPATVTGSGTGSLPSATMALVKYNTTLVINGRFLRGRSFIGPLSTAVNSGGNPTAALSASIVTAVAFLGTGATASSLVVWHRPTDLLPAGGQISPVTSYGTATEFAVLRSRRD